MGLEREIDEWNNPLKDIASGYWKNGVFTEHSFKYQVTLTSDELMLVVGYMMIGMDKIKLSKEETKC